MNPLGNRAKTTRMARDLNGYDLFKHPFYITVAPTSLNSVLYNNSLGNVETAVFFPEKNPSRRRFVFFLAFFFGFSSNKFLIFFLVKCVFN